jgi:hypothetical protein
MCHDKKKHDKTFTMRIQGFVVRRRHTAKAHSPVMLLKGTIAQPYNEMHVWLDTTIY